jgi:hypothetical protein
MTPTIGQNAEPRAIEITEPLLRDAEQKIADAEAAVNALRVQAEECAAATAEARELSLAWTAEMRTVQTQAYSEYRNPARDWMQLSELPSKLIRAVNFIDSFVGWAVEIEMPRLRLELLRAQAEASGAEMLAADIRHEIGDRSFRDSIAPISAQQLGVIAVSSLVTQLADAAKEARRIHQGLLTSIADETARQEKHAQAVASFGLVTRR